MPTRLRHVLPGLLLALIALPLMAQQSQNLEQRMGAEQFQAAGLQKLSPQELAILQRWIDGNRPVKVIKEQVDSSGKPLFAGKEQPRSSFDSSIKGRLTGWQPKQVFSLANGQQWQITDDQSNDCRPADNPKVHIRPSLFGLWLMYVPSCYANVHVKRVK